MRKILQIIYHKIKHKVLAINETRFQIRLRKQNKNTDFTLISNNCIAGIVYHNLGLQFKSPTINLYIKGREYLEFVKHLEFYTKCSLVENTDEECSFPIGTIIPPTDDTTHIPINIYFQHYTTFEEAKKKWEERCGRINWNNLYFVWEFWDNLYDIELAKEFSKLSIKKMVLLHREIADVNNSMVIAPNKESVPGYLLQYDGMTGKRYLDEFDYVKFLNE